jgi:hypothetical protein
MASQLRLTPFAQLIRTIPYHRKSIEATLEWKLTNGITDSNHAGVGRIRSPARGSATPRASSR